MPENIFKVDIPIMIQVGAVTTTSCQYFVRTTYTGNQCRRIEKIDIAVAINITITN
jgi:hypothetical protein